MKLNRYKVFFRKPYDTAELKRDVDRHYRPETTGAAVDEAGQVRRHGVRSGGMAGSENTTGDWNGRRR